MLRRGWAVLLVALLAACRAVPGPEVTRTSGPTPSASPTRAVPTPTVTPLLAPRYDSSPAGTPAEVVEPVSPDDVWSEPPPRPRADTPAHPEPPRRVPNAVRDFWVTEPASGGRRQTEARLRVQTPTVAMWMEWGVWHDIRQLEEAAEVFETHIHPRVRAAFGSEWLPGIDHDPRIHILHATGLGDDVLGYTSSIDEYPRDVHPQSNEAEMMVINMDYVAIGSPTYDGLLARQLQRLVQWHQNRNEDRWLREGLAELAVALTGFKDEGSMQGYPRETDLSLIHWADEQGQREAAYLFAAYFHQLFGDEGTRVLTSEPTNGIRGIENALAQLGSDLSFEDLYADWLVANYLDHTSDPGGHNRTYFSVALDRPTPVASPDGYPFEMDTTVQQFGAHYIVLRGDADLNVAFQGETQVPLLSVAPYSGHYAWWSNRADESLTTLTGRFDLSEVREATLSYRVWYDIELHFDYATVEAKAPGDQEWNVLMTPSGTDANPHGNSPGWSYTGRSPGWIREEIDVSSHAGGELLVRFSYLTDGAITGEGFLLDQVSIPEIGYADDVTIGCENWKAEGFLPIGAYVPQDYLALLISRGEETRVERLTLEPEEGQQAEWTVPLASEDLHEAVLILSGTAPLTSEPARYRLSIRR